MRESRCAQMAPLMERATSEGLFAADELLHIGYVCLEILRYPHAPSARVAFSPVHAIAEGAAMHGEAGGDDAALHDVSRELPDKFMNACELCAKPPLQIILRLTMRIQNLCMPRGSPAKMYWPWAGHAF